MMAIIDKAITIDTHEHRSNQLHYEYDVYLCFRGSDTRHSFTGNLYNALCCNRFKTFMDREAIKMGGQLSPLYFFKALEVSRISIVVLSEKFAYSSFCLDELVKILECRNTINQLVLPIFYGVDPSHVRKQRGQFGEALDRHEQEQRLGGDFHKLRTWRAALTEVGNLRGWHFETGHRQYEYELIEDIMNRVASILPRYHVFLSCSEDTHYSFTDYLYNAFSREGFKTFMKDRRSKDHEDQTHSQDLVKTIETSRLSIIVFSEKYAYSPESLDELVVVLDSMKNNKQLVWPIFYNVEPSDIRHQRKSCGKALIEHENKFGKDYEKLQTWRSALFEVANLKGWHLKYGYEYDLIEKIVETAIKI